MKALLVILATFVVDVALSADVCSIPPFSYPLRNYTISQGGFIQRGVYVNIGGQAQSLRLSTLYNNTNVRNAQDCQTGNSSQNAICVSNSGSVVDVTKVDGWTYAPPNQWNVSMVDPLGPDQRAIQGWAGAQFETGPATPGFPLAVSTYGKNFNISQLSIGPSSDFLDWLVAEGLAPSKIVGLFFGSRSQLQGADGEVTIGGYDRSRVAGPWFNFTTFQGFSPSTCPLQVQIRDILHNNTQGSSSLVADLLSGVPACLDPLGNTFALTPSIFNLYLHSINASIDTSNLTSTPLFDPSDSGLLGNLTFSFSNGLTTVIPDYELKSQVRGPNQQGTYTVTDPDHLSLAVARNGSLGMVTLGGVFLSQHYLLIDYEKNRFSLAPAVLGDSAGAPDLVTLCTAASNTTEGANAAPTASAAGGSPPSVLGPALGGSLGGLAGVALLAALVLWLYRRRGRSRKVPGMPIDYTPQAAPAVSLGRPENKRIVSTGSGISKDLPPLPMVHTSEKPESIPPVSIALTLASSGNHNWRGEGRDKAC